MEATPFLLAGLVLSLGLVLAAREWHLRLLGLMGQYVLVAALLSQEVSPTIGGLRFLVGLLASGILFLSLRRVGETRPLPIRQSFPLRWHLGERLGWPHHLASPALALALSYTLAGAYPFPGASWEMSFASYWLGSASLLTLVSSPGPLEIGFASLLLDSGIQMLRLATAEEASLLELALFSILTLTLAVAIAFMLAPEESHEGEGLG